MLFTSHHVKPKQCSFCARPRLPDESKIALFGYESADKQPVICDQCVIDTVFHAMGNSIESTETCGALSCDFCGKSISQYDNIYVRGEGGVCVECITEFIKILLEVGKTPGIHRF